MRRFLLIICVLILNLIVMDIRQFERQYEALKILSVNKKMTAGEVFLTFKKRQLTLVENKPASWVEVIHFLQESLVADFIKDFLCEAKNYSDAELEILFKLLEHNQELFRNVNFLHDFLVLANILVKREDSGWSTQIESALNVPNVCKKFETAQGQIKSVFASLMVHLVKEAVNQNAACQRILLQWLPSFRDVQGSVILQVRQELEKVRGEANKRSGVIKQLYAAYNVLL